MTDLDYILSTYTNDLINEGISSKRSLWKAHPELTKDPKLIRIKLSPFPFPNLEVCIRAVDIKVTMCSFNTSTSTPIYAFKIPGLGGTIKYTIDLSVYPKKFGTLYRRILKTRETLMPELMVVSQYFQEDYMKYRRLLKHHGVSTLYMGMVNTFSECLQKPETFFELLDIHFRDDRP